MPNEEQAVPAHQQDATGSEEMLKSRRELTFGEKAVGITFNVGGREDVDRIKASCGHAIDILNEYREQAKLENNGEKIRMFSVAITELQGAQMWGVKAATWQY